MTLHRRVCGSVSGESLCRAPVRREGDLRGTTEILIRTVPCPALWGVTLGLEALRTAKTSDTYDSGCEGDSPTRQNSMPSGSAIT